MCLAAVKQDGQTLRFVPENVKCLTICYAAVKQHGWALRDVPDNLKDRAMCLQSVRTSGDSLMFVPERFLDDEISECLTINDEGHETNILSMLPDHVKTYEKCMQSVKRDGQMLKNVPDCHKDKDICLTAVKNDSDALRYVPDILKDWVERHKRVEKVDEDVVTAPLWLETDAINALKEALIASR